MKHSQTFGSSSTKPILLSFDFHDEYPDTISLRTYNQPHNELLISFYKHTNSSDFLRRMQRSVYRAGTILLYDECIQNGPALRVAKNRWGNEVFSPDANDDFSIQKLFMEMIGGIVRIKNDRDYIYYDHERAQCIMENLFEAKTKVINLTAQHGAILVFPEKPSFGSWMKREELLVIHQQITSVRIDEPPDTVLVNWSSSPERFGFFVERSPEGILTTELPIFKYFRDIMPSTTFRAGHIVVDNALDVVAFKLRHFCKDEA